MNCHINFLGAEAWPISIGLISCHDLLSNDSSMHGSSSKCNCHVHKDIRYIDTLTLTVIVRMNFDSWWDVESESPHHCLIHSVFRQLGDYWPRLNGLQFENTRLGKAPLASLEDAGERSHAAFYTFGAGKNNRPMIDPVSHPSAPSPPSPTGIPPPPCNAHFFAIF